MFVPVAGYVMTGRNVPAKTSKPARAGEFSKLNNLLIKHMKTFNSEKKLGDSVKKIKCTFDLNEAIAKHGYDRIESLTGGWVIAHSVAERMKRAFGDEAKASDNAKAANKALRDRVEAGETFDASEFLPKERGADKVVLMIREKWEASQNKTVFIEKYKLGDLVTVDSSATEVEEAYLATKDDEVSL